MPKWKNGESSLLKTVRISNFTNRGGTSVYRNKGSKRRDTSLEESVHGGAGGMPKWKLGKRSLLLKVGLPVQQEVDLELLK